MDMAKAMALTAVSGMVVGAVGMVGCGGGDNKGSATPEATSTSEAAPAASQGTAK